YDAPAAFAVESAASARVFSSWLGAAKSASAGRRLVAAPSAIMDCTNSRLSIIWPLVRGPILVRAARSAGRFGMSDGTARGRRDPGGRISRITWRIPLRCSERRRNRRLLRDGRTLSERRQDRQR